MAEFARARISPAICSASPWNSWRIECCVFSGRYCLADVTDSTTNAGLVQARCPRAIAFETAAPDGWREGCLQVGAVPDTGRASACRWERGGQHLCGFHPAGGGLESAERGDCPHGSAAGIHFKVRVFLMLTRGLVAGNPHADFRRNAFVCHF
jgi:hypothetical protein